MHHPRLVTVCATLALVLTGSALAATPYEKTDSYKNPAIKAGGSLELTNLLGKVTVVPAGDGVLSVDSKVVAAGNNDQEAQTLAGKIKLDIQASGDHVSIMTRYPLDEYTSYYYRRSGEGLMIIGESNTSTSYDGHKVRVYSGTFGAGVNLHVDYVVHLPPGVDIKVDNKVGLISASDVKAALDLKSSSGDIEAARLTGALTAVTGSGDVTVTEQAGAVDVTSGSGDLTLQHQKGGDVKLDTGSGDLKLSDLAGMLTAETGSGDVDLQRYSGGGMDLQTGSGDITLNDVSGSASLHTGSGEIHAKDFKAGQAVEAHAGSGGIELDGDLSAVLRLLAESGSGDIEIHTSTTPSLRISAVSNSGDVHVDLPNMQNVEAHEHSLRAEVNGAKGSAELDAGSGDVTFTKD